MHFPSFRTFGTKCWTLLCFIWIMSLSNGLLSCQTIELPDTPLPTSKPHKVSIRAHAAANETLNYPIEVVAFAQDGQMAAHQRVKSADEKLSLSLSAGTYHLVAFSGVGTYALPSTKVEASTPIALAALSAAETTTLGRIPAATPLMRGAAQVEVSDKRTTVHLMLSHTMSAVAFRLAQIPKEVQQVRVQLSALFGQIDWNGQYGDKTTATLQAHRTADGTWTTEVGYVFPSVDDHPVATITLTDGEHEKNYAYLLPQPLLAGTPYRFVGSYSAEEKLLQLDGNFSMSQWKPWVEQSFSFGDETSNNDPAQPQPDTPQPGGPTTDDLRGFPQPASVWKGKFVVALVHPITADEADVLLLAKEQQEDMESANSTLGHEGEAMAYVREYVEEGEDNWQLPTRAEAEELATTYHGEGLQKLNEVLRALHATEIFSTVGKTKVRYLCDEAHISFTFTAQPNLRTAASKSHSFVVRCVKHVRVKRQQE